jgi:hypothetical protein
MISWFFYDIIYDTRHDIEWYDIIVYDIIHDIIYDIMYDIMYDITYDIMYLYVVLLAPYPNNLNPVESFNITTDFDLRGAAWCNMRVLNFSYCALCPTGFKWWNHWGSPGSTVFLASSAATVTPIFHTASRTIGVLEVGSASADTQWDRGNGSRLYEVNLWMWCYGQGRPRMVSITAAERIRRERISESRIRAAETRRWCSEAVAAAGASEGGGGAH